MEHVQIRKVIPGYKVSDRDKHKILIFFFTIINNIINNIFFTIINNIINNIINTIINTISNFVKLLSITYKQEAWPVVTFMSFE